MWSSSNLVLTSTRTLWTMIRFGCLTTSTLTGHVPDVEGEGSERKRERGVRGGGLGGGGGGGDTY